MTIEKIFINAPAPKSHKTEDQKIFTNQSQSTKFLSRYVIIELYNKIYTIKNWLIQNIIKTIFHYGKF